MKYYDEFHDIEMEDISNFLFNIISKVSNMRYFKSQQIALDHREEEREVNHVHDNCRVNVDLEARYLEERWLQEEEVEGVAEGLATNAGDGVHVVIVAVRGAPSH